MNLQKVQNYIRANHWWTYKAAPLLGFSYLYIYFFELPKTEVLVIIVLSAITIIGIAGLGYVINDLYDIDADIKAGKKNAFIGKSNAFKICILLILSVIAIAPWFWLKSNWIIRIALVFQMFLFVIYAHPFTRLKEKSLWGPLCDALYGHVVPIIIACLTYEQYLQQCPYSSYLFFGALFIWQILKGFRNIFIHQLEDFHHDQQSGIQTWTTIKGQDEVYQKILYFILPLEIVALFIFFIAITPHFPLIWGYFIVFLLINIYGNGLFRNIQWHPKIYFANTYLYFLNNFYEVYLPYFFLFFCISKQPFFTILLCIHVALFPSTISILIQDLNQARKEIWIQLDNFAASIKRKIF